MRRALVAAAILAALACGRERPAGEPPSSQAAPSAPSPLPTARYDPERDTDLLAVQAVPLDETLRGLVRAFPSWRDAERSDARRALGAEQARTLILFARRSAVLALREKSSARCLEGVLALAMLDEKSVDPSDVLGTAGILGHSIAATGLEQSALDPVVELATKDVQELMMQALLPADLARWGYAEVQTAQGVGLMAAGLASYAPTRDLTQLALRLAQWLDRGRYVARPQIAVKVPALWFSPRRKDEVERALASARAGAVVSARLRDPPDEGDGQSLMVWIVEMPDAARASALIADADVEPSPGRVSAAVSSGPLFALAVASSLGAAAPLESPESLAKLAEQVRAELARTPPR